MVCWGHLARNPTRLGCKGGTGRSFRALSGSAAQPHTREFDTDDEQCPKLTWIETPFSWFSLLTQSKVCLDFRNAKHMVSYNNVTWQIKVCVLCVSEGALHGKRIQETCKRSLSAAAAMKKTFNWIYIQFICRKYVHSLAQLHTQCQNTERRICSNYEERNLQLLVSPHTHSHTHTNIHNALPFQSESKVLEKQSKNVCGSFAWTVKKIPTNYSFWHGKGERVCFFLLRGNRDCFSLNNCVKWKQGKQKFLSHKIKQEKATSRKTNENDLPFHSNPSSAPVVATRNVTQCCSHGFLHRNRDN